MGEIRISYRILVGKHPLEKQNEMEDNIKRDHNILISHILKPRFHLAIERNILQF
jgi:hypothetical protein